MAVLTFDPNPPPLCQGYGNPVVIATETWEAYAVGDTGRWTAATRGVIDPDFFFDPGYPPVDKTWTVTASLPDDRPGQSAFVPNRVSGDCGALNETGAMMLDGPTIQIPVAAQVPRLVVDHWLASEDLYAPDYYDGGNFKFSVNGGDFLELPPGAIEFNGYNETLVTIGNDNPLAGEAVFAGTDPSSPPANWGQSHINLSAIASPGATVALRLDFGVDACDGIAGGGWYVDDLQYYYCSDELPPSDCGNALLDAGEQCDDGNDFIGDGCSNTCQVEPGWTCTGPLPPGGISDPGFELGTPNDHWTEESLKFDDVLICDAETCNTLEGNGPAQGAYWAWLGGWYPTDDDPATYDYSRLTQTVEIPVHSQELVFDLAMTYCDSASDYMEVMIDGQQIFMVDGNSSNPLCDQTVYSSQILDIRAFADGGNHILEFHSETFAVNSNPTNFLIDNVRIPPIRSQCALLPKLTVQKMCEPIGDGGLFNLLIDGSGSSDTACGGSYGPVEVSVGTHTVSESAGNGTDLGDYLTEIGGDCAGDGTITLAAGDNKVCTVTNRRTPTLSVQKVCEPLSDGGLFNLLIDGSGSSNTACGGNYGPVEVSVGTHTVSESAGSGTELGDYLTDIGGDCAGDGTITLAAGDNKICTVRNQRKPTLTLFKNLPNDDGGSATEEQFQAYIDASPVAWGTPRVLEPGLHIASEDTLPGYQPSGWVGACDIDGRVTLEIGENRSCSITNDDIPFAVGIFEDGFETE